VRADDEVRSRRRRRRVRGLLLAPLLGLTAIISGTIALEQLAPSIDPVDRAVEGLPPLAIEEPESCRRGSGDRVHEDLRDAFVPGSRISSGQLYLCPRAYDGLEVAYAGEVVGELLPRQGGVWAQVNDDPYALEHGPVVAHRELHGFNSGLTVWLPDGLHEPLQPGRPLQRGSVVLIEGRVLRVDPTDGGGTTLRARELQVLAEPLVVEDPLHVPQLVVAIVLGAAAVVATGWSRRVRRR